jgi:hypothetical protein
MPKSQICKSLCGEFERLAAGREYARAACEEPAIVK